MSDSDSDELVVRQDMIATTGSDSDQEMGPYSRLAGRPKSPTRPAAPAADQNQPVASKLLSAMGSAKGGNDQAAPPVSTASSVLAKMGLPSKPHEEPPVETPKKAVSSKVLQIMNAAAARDEKRGKSTPTSSTTPIERQSPAVARDSPILKDPTVPPAHHGYSTPNRQNASATRTPTSSVRNGNGATPQSVADSVEGAFPSTPTTSILPTPASTPIRTPMTPACTFSPYISREEAEEKVRKGEYVIGTLSIHKKYGGPICFVKNSKWGDVDVLIEGKENRNRALHGDVVVIELNSQDGWKKREKDLASPSTVTTGERADVRAIQLRSREEDLKLPKSQRSLLPDQRPIRRVLKVFDRVAKKADLLDTAPLPPFEKGALPTGRVVHIWRAEHSVKHVCRAWQGVKLDNGKLRSHVRFAPYDDKYPHIEVPMREIPTNIRDTIEDILVYIEIKEWEVRRNFPTGTILRNLGDANQVEAETRAILVQNGTDYTDEFSDECMSVIPDTMPIPTREELKMQGRRDLRLDGTHPTFICTIDPASARDLDDALSCEDLGGGHYRVGVHIADVATFVPFGSALDEEARKRATSVYMVQRVIPMLPRKLCEEYCSLNTISDKFAFTVEWVMDGKGNIKKEWMGQTVIRNQCKMAYEDAQAIIDGTFEPSRLNLDHIPPERRPWTVDKIKEAVTGLWKIASNIRKSRHERGALSLNQSKMWFDFQDNNSSLAPVGWHAHSTAEANWLVEEFMVLANCRVTEKCVEYCPDNSLARYHPAPEKDRFASLVKALDEQGFKMNVGSGLALSDSLDNIAKKSHQMSTIRALTIRCMMLAKYCCTDEGQDHSLSHFALNVPLYTHFTSPIRRYADLVVHRVLKCALEIEKLFKQRVANGEDEDRIELGPQDIPSGYMMLHPSDVTDIALHCNTRKEEARKASDASIQLFYCVYLQALYNMHQTDPSVNYIETHTGTLMSLKDKQFNVWIEALGFDKELYHDNGLKDQLWIGVNEKCVKAGLMFIQWKEGMYQPCTCLTEWKVKVFFRTGSKYLDYVCQIQPPPDNELIPKERVMQLLADEAANSPSDDSKQKKPATRGAGGLLHLNKGGAGKGNKGAGAAKGAKGGVPKEQKKPKKSAFEEDSDDDY